MLHGCGLVLVDAWDMKQEGLASIFTNAHHSPREIYVFKAILHSCCGLKAVLFCVASTRTFVLASGSVEVICEGCADVLRIDIGILAHRGDGIVARPSFTEIAENAYRKRH